MLSSKVENPWLNPGGIQNIILFFPLKITDLVMPYVGEFLLKSTATSSTDPLMTLTNFPCVFGGFFENVILYHSQR